MKQQTISIDGTERFDAWKNKIYIIHHIVDIEAMVYLKQWVKIC